MDEVGRGPLAGPVVAAAVILKKEHGILGLKDSKKLSPKINVIINTSQDKRGGFEKYPKDKSFDQSQYWASSPCRLKSVKEIDIIFIKIKKKHRTKNIELFLSIIYF